MLPDPVLWAALSLVGGLLALDGTGCGQFMVSRPFVAAAIAGAIAGDPLAGATLGVLLEALSLTVLPVGAARYPEGAPGAVAAGGLYAWSGEGLAALATAAVFFVAWGWLSGSTVDLLRRRSPPQLRGGGHEMSRTLERVHLGALAVDYLRGTVLVAAGIGVLSGLIRATVRVWALDAPIGPGIVGAVLAALLAGTLPLFGGRRRFFVAGVAAGLVILLLRGW